MSLKEATALAVQFHTVYEKLAPLFGYETRVDTQTFDPNTTNGRLMIATCEALLANGVVNTSLTDRSLLLTAHADGRRSKSNYPDKLIGWQYMGHLDTSGNPTGTPIWVAARLMRSANTSNVYFKTSVSICPVPLCIGDWIVRDYPENTRRCIRILTAAKVARWYHNAPIDNLIE